MTQDARRKTHFVIVDAVGVVDHPKVHVGTLDRKRTVPFAKLLEQVAWGVVSDDICTSLAARLSRLEKDLTPAERDGVRAASGGQSARDLAHVLLDAVDPDLVWGSAQEKGLADPTPEGLAQVRLVRMREAVAPFNDPDLRTRLTNAQRRSEQIVHTGVKDRLIDAGYSAESTERARQTVEAFERFLAQNRDEIAALQLIFSQPYQHRGLTLAQIEELRERVEQPPNTWTTQSLWEAYAQLERDNVRGAGTERVLTDLVSLVRHALQLDDELVPYPEQVRQRYEDWLAAQEAGDRGFTEGQRWWLDRIAETIALNLSVTPQDFQYGKLRDRGGLIAARQLFGDELTMLLVELNEELAI